MTEKHQHNIALVARYERKIQHSKIKTVDKKIYHRSIHALEQRDILGMILRFLNSFDQCRIHNCNSLFKRTVDDLLPIVYKMMNVKMRDVGSVTCVICHIVGLKMGYPLGGTSMSHYATDLKRRINLCNNCVSYRECDQCDRVFYDVKHLSYIAVDEIDDIEESRCTVCREGKYNPDDEFE